jgi:hypothetical protein
MRMPEGSTLLRLQAADYNRYLQTRAQQAAQREGAILTTELVGGGRSAVDHGICTEKPKRSACAGLAQALLLFLRLWNHTTRDLVQQLSRAFWGFIERWEPRHFSLPEIVWSLAPESSSEAFHRKQSASTL